MVPQSLAKKQCAPRGLATDGNDVFWLNTGKDDGEGALMRLPLKGGKPTVIVTKLTKPAALTVRGPTVYFTVYGSGDDDGEVFAVPAKGGTPAVLAKGLSGPSAITADETHVYWANSHYGGKAGRKIMRVPVGGGVPVERASGESDKFIAPQAVALSGKFLYWTNGGMAEYDGSVMRVGK
jgi:hypothetical protein